MDILEEFIQLSKLHGAKVAIIFSPMFNDGKKHFEGSAKYFEAVKGLPDRKQVPLWDYRSDSICFNKKYFYNNGLLSKRGAEKFSLKLGKDIKLYTSK